MIKDEVAFKQRYDTEDLNPVQEDGTDIDWVDELPNGLVVWHEWKKDISPQHDPDQIVLKKQWKKIQRAAGTEDYAIYSTHNEEVSEKNIPASKLIVRYVELNKQPIKFEPGIFLRDYLNELGATNAYFITVTYPDTKITEMALKFPTPDQKWSLPMNQASSKRCIFRTKEACIEYIKKRYEKDFNQKNKYSIYYNISKGNRSLVHEYTYPETSRL